MKVQYSLKQTIPPSCEPVSVQEAKEHLVIEHDDDNAKIAGFITSAREWCEEYIHRPLVSATYEYYLEGFPSEILLPRNPVLKVSSVKYTSTSNVLTTLTENTDYTVDKRTEPCSIIPAYGASWTSPLHYRNSVLTTYQAGYLIPYSVNATTNVLTLTNYTPTDAETFIVTHSGGEYGKVAGGLSENTIYYLRDSSGATCKLATTSGGTAIDITGIGTGQQFLGKIPQSIKTAILMLVHHLYETRSHTTEGFSKEVVMSATDLLSRYIQVWEQDR